MSRVSLAGNASTWRRSGAFLQCTNAGMRETARVWWEAQDLGDTAPLVHLKPWFVTAPKGFCFRKEFLWPALILSLPLAAQVWFSTSQSGHAAGRWGKSTQVQHNSSCANTSAVPSGRRQVLPAPVLWQYLPVFLSTWNEKQDMIDLCCFQLYCSTEVSSLFFLADLQQPWENGHIHTHCPRREEEVGRTTWLPGDAGAELRFPPFGHHHPTVLPPRDKTLLQFPLPPFSWGF